MSPHVEKRLDRLNDESSVRRAHGVSRAVPACAPKPGWVSDRASRKQQSGQSPNLLTCDEPASPSDSGG